MPVCEDAFSEEEYQFFQSQGYVICRNLVSTDICELMLDVVKTDVEHHREPFEYEADVQYPGAPSRRSDEGGMTIRRLKMAHARDPVFHEWLTSRSLISRLQRLLGPQVICPLGHHNCVMTKRPRFSSDTGWHQDIRYWNFQQPELVSTWLALGVENQQNGSLQIIPGSHRMQFEKNQFDAMKFFRDDLPANQTLITNSVRAELQQGDVLFFHSLTLHAASRNFTDQTKYAAVFTFRGAANRPDSGTRSAMSGELILPEISLS